MNRPASRLDRRATPAFEVLLDQARAFSRPNKPTGFSITYNQFAGDIERCSLEADVFARLQDDERGPSPKIATVRDEHHDRFRRLLESSAFGQTYNLLS